MAWSLCIVELRFAKEQSHLYIWGQGRDHFQIRNMPRITYNTIETSYMRVQHLWLLLLWEGTTPFPPLLLFECLELRHDFKSLSIWCSLIEPFVLNSDLLSNLNHRNKSLEGLHSERMSSKKICVKVLPEIFSLRTAKC